MIAYVTLTEGPTLMTNIVDTPHDEIAVDAEVELGGARRRAVLPREAGVTTVPALLDDAVARFGERPAIWHAGGARRSPSSTRRPTASPRGCVERGIRPGDRVAMRLPNDPAVPIWAHGAWRAGATLVSINPLYAQDAAAGDPGRQRRADPADGGRRRRPGGGGVVTDLRPRCSRPAAGGAPARRPATSRCSQYTGGTTGAPKGAMLTHANLVAGAAPVRRALPGARARRGAPVLAPCR